MTGRAQVNFWFPYDNLDFPLIDVFKMVARYWRQSGSDGTEDYFSLMDANGWPTRFASGVFQYQCQFAAYVPDPVDNDRWVATWTGGSGFTLTCGMATLTQVASSANRLEFTLTGLAAYTPVNLDFTITSLTTPITDFHFFRKSHESDYNLGKVTAPPFRTLNNRWGRIRFMDWLTTNGSTQCLWSSRVPTTRRSWVGVDIDTAAYCGEATQSGNDYSCTTAPSGNPSSWTHGQRVQMAMIAAPTFKVFSSFASTNPCQLSFASAHGFSNGQTLEFGAQPTGVGAFDNAVDGQTFACTVINSTTISIPLNATSMTYVNNGYDQKIGVVVRAKAGLLPYKRVGRFDSGSNYASTYTVSTKDNNGGTTWINLIYDSDFDALMFSSQADLGRYAFPHEIICKVANELNVSPWVCIPHQVDDDYINQMATIYRDNLNTNLIVSFEYSNELWNTAGGFYQTPYGAKKAQIKWGSADANLWYGYRFYQAMTLVATIFGGTSRINRVMACFTGAYGAGGQDNRFQAPGTGLAAYPITKADSIAIAPYFENSARSVDAQYVWQAVYGNSTQKQAAIVYFDNQLRDDGTNTGFTAKCLHDSVFPAWVAIAAAPAPGVGAKRLTWYEGGPGQFAINSFYGMTNNPPPSSPGTAMNSTDLFNAQAVYLNSPECAATCLSIWNNFVAVGGEFISQYTLTSDGASWGTITPTMFGTRRPLYYALSTFNDGVITTGKRHKHIAFNV